MSLLNQLSLLKLLLGLYHLIKRAKVTAGRLLLAAYLERRGCPPGMLRIPRYLKTIITH